MLALIWAMDESNLIGKDNKMPWHIKEDLIYFKKMTKDHIVLMGYNTYLSMTSYYKNRPFPYKKTYVLTHHNIDDERVIPIDDFEFVLNMKEDIFITGGKTIYQLYLPFADRLYISYIKGVHEGDTYIDFLDLDKFNLISETITDEVRYTIYERKK